MGVWHFKMPLIYHFIELHHASCGITVLRPDDSEYGSSKKIQLTEKSVEEICPKQLANSCRWTDVSRAAGDLTQNSENTERK